MLRLTQQHFFPYLFSALFVGLFIPATLFAYEAAPVALSKAATFITEKSAQLNGQGNPNQVPDALGWFEWGVSGRPNELHETPRQSLRGTANTLVDTNARIIGLAPSTQYFYRYVVESSRGKSVGQTVYFTTKPRVEALPPLVILETMAPTSITTSGVELRGYVSPHGDGKTSAWFEWGTTQQLAAATPVRRVSGNAAPVSASLRNLTPGTLYFYRIVGENSAGITYGAMRVFSTTGTPPPQAEQAVSQNISGTGEGDGIARGVTTSGSGYASNAQMANVTDPWSNLKLPNTVFGSFFQKKTVASNVNSGSNANTGVSGNTSSASNNVANVSTSRSPLGMFWDNLSGKSGVVVTIEKIGSKNIPAHSPVEYLVTYTYDDNQPLSSARLAITLPSDVIYIGDNTANELLIQETQGGERTYILPLGTITKGSARSFSMMGITTGSAKGFPDARAWFEYENSSGVYVVEAEGGSAYVNSAAVGSTDSNGILPSSFLGWLLYILLIVGTIIGVRKGKEYYDKRKEEIAKEEHTTSAVLSRIISGNDSPVGA